MLLIVAFAPGCRREVGPAVEFHSPHPAEETRSPMEVVFANGSSVQVEVAADPATRAQGLMFRPSLAEDRGMLFLFPESATHEFWMKNTLIPLDIVWIDDAMRVVHVAADVPPCQADPCPSFGPGAPATRVLEIASGQAAARGVRIGDVLSWRGGIENIVAR